MFLGLPDPNPLVRGMNLDPDPSIIMQNSKKVDFFCFLTLFDFLSLKNDVNVLYLQKVISTKTFSESGSISQRQGSADPDPHQNVMDPQHFL
jgi:hypothetical protein